MEKKRKKSGAHRRQPCQRLNLTDPSLYINRELGLLAFQRRVLEEAEDRENPLLERVKFLAILGSNLNEFFMVRVAGLVSQMEAGITDAGPDGMPPRAQLIAIRREIKRLVGDAYKCLASLKPELDEAGIRIIDYSDLNEVQLRVANNYFTDSAFPVLTPLAFDPGRPFPHISNLSLNLAALIRDTQGNERFARIKVPDSLPPLVPVNRAATPKQKRRRSQSHLEFVWLEQVIAAHLGSLFPGMQVLETHPFHVTRDADMAIKELEAEDLLESIEAGRAAEALRGRGAPDGGRGHAAAHPGHPDEQSGGGGQRDLSHQRAACDEPVDASVQSGPARSERCPVCPGSSGRIGAGRPGRGPVRVDRPPGHPAAIILTNRSSR